MTFDLAAYVPDDGLTHHVAATWDRGTLHVYVDGDEVA